MALERTGPRPDDGRIPVDIVAFVWRGLLSPWPLIGAAAVLLAFAAAYLALPQLPGQLNDEPAAAARWLMATRTTYGAFGGLLQALGLFNALHSFLFRAFLSFLTLLLVLHFLDSLGRALTPRSLPASLQAVDTDDGEPVRLEPRQMVYRSRGAIQADPAEVTERLHSALVGMFTTVSLPGDGMATGALIAGVRREYAYALRTMALFGLLVVLAVLWLFLLAGWIVNSPTLAPGDTYRVPAQELLIQYRIETAAPSAADQVALSLEVGGQTIATNAAPGANVHAAGLDFRVRSAEPGLLVRSADDGPILALPGQPEPAPEVGIVLSTPGAEEYILVPSLSMGLRVVRPADSAVGFLVEVYRGLEVEPAQRLSIAGAQPQSISLDEENLTLEFIPLPGLAATVQHMPGRWLIWPAAVLILAGALGYIYPPAFALVQIAPWSSGRSVVIVQASEREAMDHLWAAAHNKASLADSPASPVPPLPRTLE